MYKSHGYIFDYFLISIDVLVHKINGRFVNYSFVRFHLIIIVSSLLIKSVVLFVATLQPNCEISSLCARML